MARDLGVVEQTLRNSVQAAKQVRFGVPKKTKVGTGAKRLCSRRARLTKVGQESSRACHEVSPR